MYLLYKYKRAFLLIGMGICVIAMIITLNPNYQPGFIVRSLSYVVAPLQRGATTASNWLDTRISLLWEMNSLQEENARLREEIGWLEIEIQRLRLAGEENLHLSELLYIRQRYGDLPTIGATIISWDHSGWYGSFSIDRGSNDGIAPNMAVLGDGGLVGVVHAVYPTQSRVISIIDYRFSATVQSVRTEDIGIISGDSTLMQQGLVRMDHISETAHIMAGDELLTSIYSHIFPPAIMVGTVIEVRPTPDRMAQYAIVNPAADNIRRLEHVLVVNQLFTNYEGEADRP